MATQEDSAAQDAAAGATSSSFPPPPSPDQRAPWLVFSHGKYDDTQTFVNLSDGESSFVRNTPGMHSASCYGCSHGWVVMTAYSNRCCFLLNPATMQKIKVPPLPWNLLPTIRSVFLTGPPTDPDTMLVLLRRWEAISDRIIFCSVADKTNKSWRSKKHQGDCGFYDLVNCGGSIYGFTWKGELVKILGMDARQQPKFKLLKVTPAITSEYGMLHEWRLVEFCGEMYLITAKKLRTGVRFCTFGVFKMNFAEMKWERVTSLEDRAFFMSDFSPTMSCSASEPNVLGNSIYFIQPHEIQVRRFDLATGLITDEVPAVTVPEPWKHIGWVKL